MSSGMSALAGRMASLARRVSGLTCWMSRLTGRVAGLTLRMVAGWVARLRRVDVAVVALALVTFVEMLEVPDVISLALDVLR
jgi:hypothetical protein